MDTCGSEIELLFETSWEVCNKIGGIYTVLSTKAKTLHDQYSDKLIFIGPDVWTEENPSPFFTEDRRLLRPLARKMRLPEGVDVRFGRWEVPGRPIAALVKFEGMYASKYEAYGRMWERFGVDSLHAYGDYDEGCAFARAAAAVIESITGASGTDPMKVIAHFDEWTTAMGLLQLRDRIPEIATVFTTHATSIGRSICGNGKPLYDQLPNYNGDQMARELNMEAKHSLEKAAAREADAFTTVSDVTDAEAAQLLEKKADVVTPNGFEPNFVPAGAKYGAARRKARRTLLEVASTLTGQHFGADTFIVATSGRCEYRNKGLDVFLDSLNALRGHTGGRQVLAYVMVPAWCSGPREDLHHNLLHGTVGRLSDPLLTHGLHNYHDDPVCRRIHQIGFANDGTDGVTAIYVPCYLNGNDGIFNLSYYDLLPGLDATVFASYYEPWGYTPLESVAFGVPTVTTSLAGFGCWVREILPGAGFAGAGVSVAERTDANYTEVARALADDLLLLLEAKDSETKKFRTAARATAARAHWAEFIKYYDQAYAIALQHRNRRIR